MRAMVRQAHAVVAWLWVAAILGQVFLAGSAIRELGGSGTFATHIEFGFTMGIVQLAALLTAIGGGMSRRDIGISLGILLLYIVQTSLPSAKGPIAALHPVNAMLLFGLSVWYARRAWRARAPMPDNPVPMTPAEPAEAG
jgi:hypothetical protein